MVCFGSAANDDDVMKFDSAAPPPASKQARNATVSTSTVPTIDMEQFRRLPDLSKQDQHAWSPEEAAQCDGREGRRLCIIYDGALYDVTDFVHMHPGGATALRALGGRDATTAMRAAPMPPVAFQLLQRFHVGTISEPTEKAPRAPPSPDTERGAAPAQMDDDSDCSYGNRLLDLCDGETSENQAPDDPLSW